MKVMRMATLGVALLLAATAGADAQGGGGGGRGGGRGRGGQAALMANITLDAAVQAKVDSVFAKYQAQVTEIRTAAMTAAGVAAGGGGGGGGGGGRGGFQLDSTSQAKVNDLNTKRNAEVKALLNADQQKVFDENVAAQAARGRRGGGGGAPPPR
jgi:hypothetical protein